MYCKLTVTATGRCCGSETTGCVCVCACARVRARARVCVTSCLLDGAGDQTVPDTWRNSV